MRFFVRRGWCWVAAIILSQALVVSAQYRDRIGATTLSAVTNLNGAGIQMAQIEASDGASLPAFEVNPVAAGQATNIFTYISSVGSTNAFPNLVGNESGHADNVAKICFGISAGIATNVDHVLNYDADYFFNSIVVSNTPDIHAVVANQSFIFCNADYSHLDLAAEESADSEYDNYSAQYRTLFISGAGNGGPTNQAIVFPPATCYNGIGVGAFGGGSSGGPTLDNGRCKPDIVAPASETSFSTPQVAGAAVLLMQAALRGDAGADTNSASDLRTVKALLLNGAVKPVDWTNSSLSPLDLRYGAGVLNVFNSYEQLAGGKHDSMATNTVSLNAAHPPISSSGAISTLMGWNFATNSSGKNGPPNDCLHHYFFNVTNADSSASFMATATLVWNRQRNQSAINNLNLFLYNCANSNLVTCSTSLVDNVEHIYVPQLSPGRYDLQVWKAGGASIVSAAEPYALAWQFVPQPVLSIQGMTSAELAWPLYPAGFQVVAGTNLVAGSWRTNGFPAAVITNGQNRLWVNATNSARFFRLEQLP